MHQMACDRLIPELLSTGFHPQAFQPLICLSETSCAPTTQNALRGKRGAYKLTSLYIYIYIYQYIYIYICHVWIRTHARFEFKFKTAFFTANIKMHHWMASLKKFAAHIFSQASGEISEGPVSNNGRVRPKQLSQSVCCKGKTETTLSKNLLFQKKNKGGKRNKVSGRVKLAAKKRRNPPPTLLEASEGTYIDLFPRIVCNTTVQTNKPPCNLVPCKRFVTTI